MNFVLFTLIIIFLPKIDNTSELLRNYFANKLARKNRIRMSKRLSSQFNFAPQLKKHIGDVDVAYVFDRQSIYDKTIDLLYNGAKLKPTSHIKHSLSDTTNCISPSTTNSHLKQMILTNNCQLQTKTLVDRSNEISLGQFEKCSFCEKLGCFISLKRCFKCNDMFCNNCSFSLYSNDDETLCLSCYK